MIDKLKIHKLKILGGLLGIFMLVGAVFSAYKLGQRQVYPEPVEGPTPTPLVTCGPCPQFVPPHPDFCKDGIIIPGEKDECGCQTPPICQKEKPTVSLDKTNGRCQADTDKQVVNIWAEGTLVKFSGTIVETSPCDKLSANAGVVAITLTSPAQKNINIFLINEGYDGICVQCVGAIDFSGTVKGVSEGDYTVKIFLNAGGKTISLGRKKVTLK